MKVMFNFSQCFSLLFNDSMIRFDRQIYYLVICKHHLIVSFVLMSFWSRLSTGFDLFSLNWSKVDSN